MSEPEGFNTFDKKPPQEQLAKLLEHYQSGLFNQAENLAITLTQEFPEHPFGWKVLGALLRNKGRKLDALRVNKRVADLSPQDAEAQNNFASSLQDLGKLEEALASLKRAVTLKSDFPEAHYNMGNALRELSRFEEAETSYKRAVLLKGEFAQAFNNLGTTLKILGKNEEAEANLRKAIDLLPNYVEAYNNLGILLSAGKRWEEAESVYKKGLAVDPENVNLRLSRWQLLFDTNQFEAALKEADFCDTPEARVHGLETLFALGRIEQIYQRISKFSDSGKENIALAAFAAFISNRESRETTYKFCEAPLAFMHVSNLSNHINGSREFITEILEELSELQTIWEPVKKSTRGGFQTPAHLNLFENKSPNITKLNSIIFDELDLYHHKFENETCSYIKNWPATKNIWGWHVLLKRQGYQSPHIHTSGWLSGVIYLKVVPSSGRNEGAIEFSLDGETYSDRNSPKLIHQPQEGDIVFFPSSLHHRTIPFTEEMDRVIVSFDLMPESSMVRLEV